MCAVSGIIAHSESNHDAAGICICSIQTDVEDKYESYYSADTWFKKQKA